MICAEEIGYEYEIQENTSIDRIRNEYRDGVILWINGSGKSPEGKLAKYRCVLDYKGHTKYIEKALPGATTNQAMLTGAIEAMECVNKQVRIFLVAPTQLGFVKCFKGKGVNADLAQEFCEMVKTKNCQFTEVQFYGGADKIKKFVYACNPDKSAREDEEKKQEIKKKYKSQYEVKIYKECLEKVLQVLTSYGVESSLLDEVMKIEKEIEKVE